MKKKSMLLFLSAILLSIAWPSLSQGATTSPYSESLLNVRTQTFSVSSSKTLFVDKNNNQIQLLDLSTGNMVWTKNFPALFDCEVLMNPTKIVVITEEKKKPQKLTFSADGNQLSQQTFTGITVTEDQKLQWSRIQDKERLALVDEDQLLVYQYPWKKPFIHISIAGTEDKGYESTVLEDIQFQLPYAVLKFYGSSLVQTRDYYKIVNYATKEIRVIPLNWNVGSDFVIEGTSLVINTSSNVGSLGIDTNVEQTIYARYGLKTGQATTNIKRKFTTNDFYWSSSYFNGNLLVIDTEKNQQELFQAQGQLLKKWPIKASILSSLNSRLVGYNKGQAFSLIRTEEQIVELRAD
jgi:hypothetical protein